MCVCVCLCLHDLHAKQIWQTAERKAGKKQTQIKQQIVNCEEEQEEERKRMQTREVSEICATKSALSATSECS